MNTKDHLVEKLRLKERAEEDQYFAERDRNLITKLKQEQAANQENTIRELAHGRCPQCGVRLVAHTIHEVAIEECPECQGIWLSKGKLGAVAQRGGEPWAARFLEGLVSLLEHPPR